MKRVLVLIALLAVLVQPGMAYTQAVYPPRPADYAASSTSEMTPSLVPDSPDPMGHGMPPRPIQAKPIPHHEAGRPSRAAAYTTQVTRLNEEGLEETVQLTGLDAMVADGQDPLAGNHGLVDWDKLLFGAYDGVNATTVKTLGYTTPTLRVITDTAVSVGHHKAYDIAAGDLNGDGLAEEIAAWINADNHLYMRIGEMPGAQRATSAPAVVAAGSMAPPDGYALDFDGADDFVAVSYGAALANRSFTVAFWARRDSLDRAEFVVGQGTTDYNQYLHIGFREDNTFTCAFYANDLKTSSAYTDTVHWHHWACTYDAISGDRTIYRDGVQVAQDTGVAPYIGSGSFTIGRGLGYYFDGLIDEVGIWNVARTQGQIQADMVRWAPEETGVLGYWSFDEGSGTTTADVSGCGHTGTFRGEPTWNVESAPLGDGELHVLVRGYDEALWHCIYDADSDVCLSWDNLAGGLLASAPAAVSRAPGQLDVFALGFDNLIYQQHWDGTGGWSDWEQEPPDPTLRLFAGTMPTRTVPGPDWDGPAAVARDGGIDLFRVAPDNTLRWRRSEDGTTWGAWQALGGMLTSGPGVVSPGPDQMQVFARGVDEALWTRTYDGAWGAWERVPPDGMAEGVTLASPPAPVSPAPGEVTVSVRGSDDQVWRVSYAGGSWGTWSSGSGLLASGVGAAFWNGDTHLFALAADGRLQHSDDGATWTGSEAPEPLVTYDTGVVAAAPAPYTDIDNFDVAVATGRFLGDGRDQVVVAYRDSADRNNYHIELYDVQSGFAPTLLAEASDLLITAGAARIATGDFDGDGLDEIAVVTIISDTHWWRLQVYDAYDEQGEWLGALQMVQQTLEYDGGRSFAGTLAIVSGDFDGDRRDEIAVSHDWCDTWWIGWPVSQWKYLYTVRWAIFDDLTDNLAREMEDSLDLDQAAYGAGGFLSEALTGLALAAGDLNGDGVDEIVRTWPDGPQAFHSGHWPKLYRRLEVWDASDLSAPQEQATLHLGHYSFGSWAERLVVGDLDRDLIEEIALFKVVYEDATEYPDEGHLQVHVYEYSSVSFEDFPGSLVWQDSVYPDPITLVGLRSPKLVAADFTGESLRVGPPSYRLQRSTGDIIALINEPPKHIDTLDGFTYDINSTDTGTYAAYENELSQSTEMSIQVQRDWGFAAGMETCIGDPEGTHVRTSLDTTYGTHFGTATTAFSQVSFGSEVQAASDDFVYYTGKDLQVWEYPVYEDNSREPTGRIMVVFPVPGPNNTGTQEYYEAGNSSCDFWYAPEHQVNNVWSYPLLASQFKDFDSERGILNPLQHVTVGPSPGEFWTQWVKVDEGERSNALSQSVNSVFEAQIGGDTARVSATPFGVGVSYEVHLPSLQGTLENSYSQEALSTHTVIGSVDTTVRVHFNAIDPSGIYNYEVTPYLYWAKDGYLVLDYLTNPKNTAFWNRYDKPDPAFILPWAGGQCPGKDAFSKDIVISPPFAGNGETVVITATVHNFSPVAVSGVPVRFYLGDPADDVRINPDQTVDLAARDKVDVSVTWPSAGTGEQRIYAVIDPDRTIPEMHDQGTNAENDNNTAFGVIAMGDSGYVDPGGQVYMDYQHLTYADTQGLPSNVFVPTAATTETVRFQLTSLTASSVVRRGFTLAGYKGGGDRDDPWDLTFNPVPAAVWLRYSEDDIADLDENTLTLYTRFGSENPWIDAACGEALRFPEENELIVPICRTGDFALLGPQLSVYLPLVLR